MDEQTKAATLQQGLLQTSATSILKRKPICLGYSSGLRIALANVQLDFRKLHIIGFVFTAANHANAGFSASNAANWLNSHPLEPSFCCSQ